MEREALPQTQVSIVVHRPALAVARLMARQRINCTRSLCSIKGRQIGCARNLFATYRKVARNLFPEFQVYPSVPLTPSSHCHCGGTNTATGKNAARPGPLAAAPEANSLTESAVVVRMVETLVQAIQNNLAKKRDNAQAKIFLEPKGADKQN